MTSLESVLRASEEEFEKRFEPTGAFNKSDDGRTTVIADTASLKAFLRQAQLKVLEAVREECEGMKVGSGTKSITWNAALDHVCTRLDEAKKQNENS